jgi:sulfite exporter TauE/SafE
MISLSIGTAFLVGLFGATHCVGMCGGIVTALESRRGVIAIRSTADRPALAYRLAWSTGRIASYSLAGALAGTVGSAAWIAQHVLPVQQAAFVLTNAVLVLLGLHLLGWQRPAYLLEGLSRPLWRTIAPVAARSLGVSQPNHREKRLAGALRAGLLWGWVPCGMVYGVLAAGLVSGSALDGAAIMLAFGLGTLPGLLAAGWAVQRLSIGLNRPSLRRAMGALIMFMAIAGLARIDPLSRLHDVGVACLQWLQP